MEVRDADGAFVFGSVVTGQPLFSDRANSLVVQNTNSPVWNDVFRIDLPTGTFVKAHLLFTLRALGGRDRNGTVFAFACLPLVNPRTQTVLVDGERVLSCRRNDNMVLQPPNYLESGPSDKSSMTTDDVIYVRTSLVSNKLTQDPSLTNFLRSRQLLVMGRGLVPPQTLIRELFGTPDTEIVKFAPEILSVLKEMIVSEHGK